MNHSPVNYIFNGSQRSLPQIASIDPRINWHVHIPAWLYRLLSDRSKLPYPKNTLWGYTLQIQFPDYSAVA